MNRRDFINRGLASISAFALQVPVFAQIKLSLPRVLIIGDSISIGYYPFVQELLKDKAIVQHNPGNAEHTGTGLEKVNEWLGSGQWDVIHFNWGLWDLCYRHPDSPVYGNRDKENGELTNTTKQYKRNLQELVKILQARGDCLIWANTTPVPPGEAGRFEDDAIKYNRAALTIMKKNRIRVNDLFGYMLPHWQKYQVSPGDVHYTPEGYRFLAEKVAEQISACL